MGYRAFSLIICCILLRLEPVNGFLLQQRHRSFRRITKIFEKDQESILPDNNNNQTKVVTKEMFLRDLLKDPKEEDDDEKLSDEQNVTVKRKANNKRGKGYKVLDNRDRLPFAVTVSTPDPYTHPDEKKKAARKQSKKNSPKKRHDAVEAGITSSLYFSGSKKKSSSSSSSSPTVDPKTHLGDFCLDKYTTTGDLLEIDDIQYRVVQHRCQYKYAGGKRFVMVKKILHVKEVGRLQKEEYLQRQFAGKNKEKNYPPEEA